MAPTIGPTNVRKPPRTVMNTISPEDTGPTEFYIRFVSKPETVGRGDSAIQLRYTSQLNQVLDDYIARASSGSRSSCTLRRGRRRSG